MHRPTPPTRLLLTAALACATLAPLADARIRLVSLPARERVEVQLDHPGVTLIEEERVVPLVAGTNQIDFAWANTQIDPGTIVFRVLGPDAEGDQPEVNVIAVSYPPGENALVWDVHATQAAAVRVRISYLLGGLDRSFSYRAVASNDESTLTLSQYVRVHNFAPEQYGPTTLYTGFGEPIDRPLGSNETRELLVARFADVPITKTYTCNPAEFGYNDRARDRLTVPMHYVLSNTNEQGLGTEPMPRGKVRIFQRDSQGTTAFTGEDWGDYTPIDDDMRLSLGVAQDVIVERRITRNERTPVAGNLFHQDVTVTYTVQNTKDTPILLDVLETIAHLRNEVGLRQDLAPQWTLGDNTDLGTADDERSTLEQVAHRVQLPARAGDETESLTFTLHLRFHNEFDGRGTQRLHG